MTWNTSFNCGVGGGFFFFSVFFFPSPPVVALLSLLRVSGALCMPCVQAGALGQWGVWAGPQGQQGLQLARGSRVGVGPGLAPAELQDLRCVWGPVRVPAFLKSI